MLCLEFLGGSKDLHAKPDISWDFLSVGQNVLSDWGQIDHIVLSVMWQSKLYKGSLYVRAFDLKLNNVKCVVLTSNSRF